MDLVLHIGTEKTGTTSLQDFLAANREILRRQGILFPTSAGGKNHKILTLAAQVDPKSNRLPQKKKVQTELLDDLGKELSEGRYDRAIMSSEFCSSQLLTDAVVCNLRDFLSQMFSQIQIVVYVRRQDEFLLSRYSTGVKTGRTTPLRIPSPHHSSLRFDHWELLSRWARVFGRPHIVCRRFEAESLESGDIVDDFLVSAKIDRNLPFERPARQNESLDAECAEFLRIFNKFSPQTTISGVRSKRGIVGLLGEISTGPPVALDGKILGDFMRTFGESNKKVADEYFGGVFREDSDDPLFGPRKKLSEPMRDPILTIDRAVEIAAHLWDANMKRIEFISRRAKRKRARPG